MIADFCKVGSALPVFPVFLHRSAFKISELNIMTVLCLLVRLVLKYFLSSVLVYIFEKWIIMYMRELKGRPAKLNAIILFNLIKCVLIKDWWNIHPDSLNAN